MVLNGQIWSTNYQKEQNNYLEDFCMLGFITVYLKKRLVAVAQHDKTFKNGLIEALKQRKSQKRRAYFKTKIPIKKSSLYALDPKWFQMDPKGSTIVSKCYK